MVAITRSQSQNRQKTKVKLSSKYNGNIVHGLFKYENQNILIYSSVIDINAIICIVSHESLHKSLYNTIGEKECHGLDEYLHWRGTYTDLEKSGI